jgi:phospholipid/cholesterol/gamma-HCH transport system substrate-binding protein
MITSRYARTGLAVILVMLLAAGVTVAGRSMWHAAHRTHITAYFDNTNGVFVGDEVRILGVPVGAIETIQPQPQRAKVSFWIDRKYRVPADAKAVILAPQLVTARAIQLTPAFTGGPALADGAVISQDRTAVPMEWDDVRRQLERLTDTLQPTEPGGVSTLGALVDTAADNLRGQGTSIRDTIVKLSQAISALGDHSNDIFSTVKNLSVLVSALQSSTELMARLNRNLASVTGLLAADPNAIGRAMDDLSTALGDVRSFVSDNRERIGATSDKLASVTQALAESLDDIKELLHVAPNGLQDLTNVYQPAQAALTGLLAANNFADPISFLCGAVQAASRLGAEQSSKLCVQYLAPIIKNRQYNFLPLGENLFVGAQARPNEVTYSENWMRPDYVPPPAAPGPKTPPPAKTEPPGAPPPAEPGAAGAAATDPTQGLPGLMLPTGDQP